MRDQMLQRTPTMLHSNYSYVGSSSFKSEDNKSYTNSDFNISRELLIDPKDVMVGEMIGQGSYSIVYKGLFKNQEPVAVKIMQPSRPSAVTREQRINFEREVLLLSCMKHENIVKFIGACIEPHLMIVTELLEGGSLQKTLRNTRPNTLDLKVSLNYALNISRAMDFLHSNCIIHRDLKPGNILVTDDMTQVKIADFGTAREETKDYMTSEVGTYRWMAPEVCNHGLLKIVGKSQYDHKVDVYSFAIVLWELLTNKPPFGGINGLFVPYLVSQNQRPCLRDILDGAGYILESCWAKDPKARPEFKEITILLEKLLECLCSDSRGAAATSSEEAGFDKIDDSKTNINQSYNYHDMKPKEKKKKKKKMVNMVLPFIRMFKACLYKHD